MVAGTISCLKPSMTPDVAHQTDGKAESATADDSCVCNRLAHIQRTTFRESTCSHSDNLQSTKQASHSEIARCWVFAAPHLHGYQRQRLPQAPLPPLAQPPQTCTIN